MGESTGYTSVEETGREIAIISMVGRFPGAKTLEEFWQNLANGVESISFFTEAEMEAAGIEPQLYQHPQYVRAKGAIADIEYFDANFFDYTPREAAHIDPQQRIFLECAWESLEKAGYDPFRYEGLIGVYAGAAELSYLTHLLQQRQNIVQSAKEDPIFFGNSLDFLSTRVSYKCNLRGPSLTVQTACSTSLVAVHQACQSLLNYECDLALAGGVSLSAPNPEGYLYQEGAVVSPDGHCRAFDADAKGTLPANGVGVVLLKRYQEAIAEGDTICAVIKGSGINNDGKQKVGYTAPSIAGQAEAISLAHAMAEIDPEHISYIEAHGTGTPLGDPVEIAALTQAFQCTTAQTSYCAIGSLKTNLGHLKAAAGIAGLIKTVLCLQHQQIPPSLNYQTPNPKIDFTHSPFYVNTQLISWNRSPRLAGVSSFGIGGTNAHVVLAEAPPSTPVQPSRPYQLLLLSAKTRTALETATLNLANHLHQNPQQSLADIAFTLQTGRKAFDCRRFTVASDTQQATDALLGAPLTSEQVQTQHCQSKPQAVIFLFPGQGSQYVNMGKELYQSEPLYREQVDFCQQWLQENLQLDLLSYLYPSHWGEGSGQSAVGFPYSPLPSLLIETQITQLALFVVEYALAQLLISWDIKPTQMIGHSIGEYVAACIAGVFSLEDALTLVYHRGRLMQNTEEGAMLAIPLAAEQLLLEGYSLSVAALNSPSNCVVSGSLAEISQLEEQLNQQGIVTQRLKVNRGFHSALMEPALAPFAQEVQKVSLRANQIPFISNVTGYLITEAEVTNPTYWTRHIRETVRFSQGMQNLLAQPDTVILEVGPGYTLSRFAKKHPQSESARRILTTLPHVKNNQQDSAWLYTLLGQLWLSAVPIDWMAFSSHERRMRVPLPTYPFERQRYWLDTLDRGKGAIETPARELAQRSLANYFSIPSWKRTLAVRRGNQYPQVALVLMDESLVATELVAELRACGCQVFVARVGEQFLEVSSYEYHLNPAEPEDYVALMGCVMTQGCPETIVQGWSLGADGQERGFYSLLYLAQALDRHQITTPIQIWAIANNTQAIEATDVLEPTKTTLLGACLVIPQEYPNIRVSAIDMPLPDAQETASTLVQNLLLDITAATLEPVIAYRGSYRWVQIFEPLPLEQSLPTLPLRPGGVYLITGGLGRLGLVLAKYLGQRYQAKLILVSRRSFPDRNQWHEALKESSQDPATAEKITLFHSLEAAGAEIQVFCADVANLEQMREVIEKSKQIYGEINGVIHSAAQVGEEAFRPIAQTSQINCEQQFTPKIQGTLVLEHLLGNEPNFYVLMSSLASILGGLGFVGYAAANRFLDAFALQQSQRQNDTPWISINWDGWQVVLKEQEQEQWTSAKSTLTTAEGLEAFERILSLVCPCQVAVSRENLEKRVDRWLGEINGDKTKQLPESQSEALLKENEKIAHPTNIWEEKIAEIWQEILGIETVGIDRDFFDLNGDSLQVVQVVSRIREILKVPVTPDLFFEHPTIAGLVQALSSQDIYQDMMPRIAKIDNREDTDISEKVNLLSEEKVNVLLNEFLSE